MPKLLLVLLLWSSALPAADYVFSPALPDAEPEVGQVLALASAGDRLLMAGERGLIAWSDDNGKSWQQARVPVSQTLTALSFPSEEQGWAVGHGGVILHTGDGGESWQLQFDGESANKQWLGKTQRKQTELEKLLGISPPDETEDLEYELEEVLYEIEDTELALKSGPADPFLDVWFADQQRGWAVGAYGLLFSTTNGGLQWELATAGIENSERYHYYRVVGSDSGTMYLSGEAGIIYRSDDGGESWQRLPLDYDGSLFGVIATSESGVVCFGLRGNIFRSDDRGETWSSVTPADDPGFSFYGGERLDGGNIVLVGAGGIMASSHDDGEQFNTDVHTSRSTFSTVLGVDGDLLLAGMTGLVRIQSAKHAAGNASARKGAQQ